LQGDFPQLHGPVPRRRAFESFDGVGGGGASAVRPVRGLFEFETVRRFQDGVRPGHVGVGAEVGGLRDGDSLFRRLPGSRPHEPLRKSTAAQSPLFPPHQRHLRSPRGVCEGIFNLFKLFRTAHFLMWAEVFECPHFRLDSHDLFII
jgi:hypothetical protein